MNKIEQDIGQLADAYSSSLTPEGRIILLMHLKSLVNFTLETLLETLPKMNNDKQDTELKESFSFGWNNALVLVKADIENLKIK